MQEDVLVTSIEQWMTENFLTLNAAKFLITRSKTQQRPQPYLAGQLLYRASSKLQVPWCYHHL